MKLLSDDARNAATAPISAGSAMRWSGDIEAKTFMPSSPTASFASSVAVGPGDNTFTRMPVPFRSSRSEEHTSELQSLMRSSYDVFCLKKKKQKQPEYQHYKSYLSK